MHIPEGAWVQPLQKGDVLIYYPTEQFAVIRVRADGAVRYTFTNEPLDDAELEAEARALVAQQG